MPRFVRSFFVLVALFVVSLVADAATPAIARIEVKSLVRSDRDLVAPLRESVESELAKIDLSGAPKGAHYVLAASLVKLETTTNERAARTTCRVSITLRDAKRGALHAILDGTALAEDVKTDAASRGAIDGAVRGAMRGLSEAVRQGD